MTVNYSSGLPLLHQLLNTPLVLTLLTADTSTPVATTSVDFGPFAQGLDQFAANGLKLTASDGQNSVAPTASLNVKVMLLKIRQHAEF